MQAHPLSLIDLDDHTYSDGHDSPGCLLSKYSENLLPAVISFSQKTLQGHRLVTRPPRGRPRKVKFYCSNPMCHASFTTQEMLDCHTCTKMRKNTELNEETPGSNRNFGMSLRKRLLSADGKRLPVVPAVLIVSRKENEPSPAKVQKPSLRQLLPKPATLQPDPSKTDAKCSDESLLPKQTTSKGKTSETDTELNLQKPTAETSIKSNVSCRRPIQTKPKETECDDRSVQSNEGDIDDSGGDGKFQEDAKPECEDEDCQCPACLAPPARVYKCNFCPEEFNSSLRCSEHRATHDRHFWEAAEVCKPAKPQSVTPVDEGNPFQCKICGEEFDSEERACRHMKEAHMQELQPYRCKLCDKKLSSKSSMRCHLMRHHSAKRDFKCDVCGKAFAFRVTLKRHAKIHSLGKSHLCQICGKLFATESTLDYHHKGVHMKALKKNHECEQCGKCFDRISKLELHRSIHSKERDHLCDVCGKTFKNKNVLTYHKKTCINEVSDKGTAKRLQRYKCSACQKNFASYAALADHVTLAHEKECIVCGTVISTARELKDHKKICRKIPRSSNCITKNTPQHSYAKHTIGSSDTMKQKTLHPVDQDVPIPSETSGPEFGFPSIDQEVPIHQSSAECTPLVASQIALNKPTNSVKALVEVSKNVTTSEPINAPKEIHVIVETNSLAENETNVVSKEMSLADCQEGAPESYALPEEISASETPTSISVMSIDELSTEIDTQSIHNNKLQIDTNIYESQVADTSPGHVVIEVPNSQLSDSCLELEDIQVEALPSVQPPVDSEQAIQSYAADITDGDGIGQETVYLVLEDGQTATELYMPSIQYVQSQLVDDPNQHGPNVVLEDAASTVYILPPDEN